MIMNLDWLEFTYLNFNGSEFGCTVYDNFCEEFPELEKYMEQMHMLKYGISGYSNCLQFNDDFMIWYNPKYEEMGVHVVFPGHSMHMLCDIFNLPTINDLVYAKDLLQILDNRSCRITRLDICYDDYEKMFTPQDFVRFDVEGRIRTNTRTFGYLKSRQNEGHTVYIGKRGSERYLRIYDKNYESGGKINAIRYEFELRRDYVREIARMIRNCEFFTFADLIGSFIEIIDDYDNSNGSDLAISQRKSRAGVDEKWQLLMEQMQLFAKQQIGESKVDVIVPREKQQLSINRSLRWFRSQVLPTAASLCLSLGDERFLDIVKSGQEKLNLEKQQMIRKYLTEVSLLDIDFDAFHAIEMLEKNHFVPDEYYMACNKIKQIQREYERYVLSQLEENKGSD